MTTTTSQVPGEPSTEPSAGFRRDIEGLRGLAVTLVVLEHTFGQPVAGFIGVDVFFVISGFLITGLLLREWRTNGTISLTAFYARRARRILPVALVALVLTVCTAFALWTLPRAFATLLDGVAALLFVENWHLVAVGTDYLAADGGTSPLQHFWSLAVEEQFYLFWPVLIAAAGFLALRIRGSRRSGAVAFGGGSFGRGSFGTVALVAITAVTICSMLYAAWRMDTAPTAAYFDSGARFWELGLGAVVAVAAPRLARCPLGLRRAAVMGGTVVVLGSSVGLASSLVPSHPWPAAVIPVLGAALIVGFGGPGTEHAAAVLTNPLSRGLGRISYSLYLWHVPVIVFASSLGLVSVPAGLVVILVCLGIATLSYRFIELPARRSRWLRGWERPAPVRRGPRRRAWWTRQVALGAAIAVVVAIAAVAQLRGPAPLVDPNALAAAIGTDGGGITSAAQAEAALTDDAAGSLEGAIAAAARAPAWPGELSPALDQAFSGQMAAAMRPGGCRFDVDSTAAVSTCAAGAADADRVALVIGDSIALSWTPAIIEALVPLGWSVEALGFASCPAVDVDIMLGAGDDGFAAACSERRIQLQALVETVRPDLLILSSSQRGFDALSSLATGAAAAAEWSRGTTSTLTSLAPFAGRTVVVSNPPRGQSPSTCATRLTGPGACVRDLDETYRGKNDAERDGVARAVVAGVPASHVDTRAWFCTAGGRCPAQIGRVLLRTDQWHLTETAALGLASRMRAALEP